MTMLESVNAHPIAGLIVLAALLLIERIVARWRGKTDASKIERESLTIVRQMSETVNVCKTETHLAINAINEHIAENDFGQLSAKIDSTVQMLAQMVDHQNKCLGALDRVSGLVRSIADDLQKTDSRIVHAQIQSKVHSVEELIRDVKRIVLNR